MKLQDIQPMLTVKEQEMLSKADHIHEDPKLHTDPSKMNTVTRLMRLGLLKQLREPEIHYEVTPKGRAVLNQK